MQQGDAGEDRGGVVEDGDGGAKNTQA